MFKLLKKIDMRQAIMVIAILAVVYMIATCGRTSTYSIEEAMYAPSGTMAAGPSGAPVMTPEGGCKMEAGTGLASSLLPREVASQEDFGQFAPEDVLSGQNFLEPRNQIGVPETMGGALRNANQQIRAEPPNPKDPFVWNNSTIVPDLMQRPLM